MSLSAPHLDRCPACGSRWQPSRQVAAVPLPGDDVGAEDLLAAGATLRYGRCGECDTLAALDRRRDPEALAHYYRNLPTAYWEGLGRPDRFVSELEPLLEVGSPGRELWDVGCGEGSLLEALGPGWAGHGIEPGEAAASRARERGLDVRTGTASGLALEGVADAVLAVDVAEHLLEPRRELGAMFAMLRPGGLLVILTGDAAALTARFAGSSWYYLLCIGHVTIFSRKGLKALLEKVGFHSVEARRMEHQASVGARRWLRRAAGNGLRRLRGRPAAPFLFFRDHQLALARKPG